MLVSEETGSAIHPGGGGYTLTLTLCQIRYRVTRFSGKFPVVVKLGVTAPSRPYRGPIVPLWSRSSTNCARKWLSCRKLGRDTRNIQGVPPPCVDSQPCWPSLLLRIVVMMSCMHAQPLLERTVGVIILRCREHSARILRRMSPHTCWRQLKFVRQVSVSFFFLGKTIFWGVFSPFYPSGSRVYIGHCRWT